MKLDEICSLPVASLLEETAHLYLWVPNALMPEGIEVLKAWGFAYKTNMIWSKVRKDGGPDGRGVGFYFRNVTEMILFGVKGKERPDASARADPSQYYQLPEAGALTQAGLIIRNHRTMQPRTLFRDVCPRRQAGWFSWGIRRTRITNQHSRHTRNNSGRETFDKEKSRALFEDCKHDE